MTPRSQEGTDDAEERKLGRAGEPGFSPKKGLDGMICVHEQRWDRSDRHKREIDDAEGGDARAVPCC